MTDSYGVDKRNRVRQLAEKARYDADTVYTLLDAGLVAHVGFATDDGPVVVPMIYARDGDTLYLHGARKARVIRMLEREQPASVNVTLVDGIVLARSAFNSSMNYRSVTVFGIPRLIDEREEKLHAMRCISEHLMPGRWDELRAPHEREIKMTGVIALPIDSASAKISAGQPDDEEEDYEIPVWAGVLPVTTAIGELVTDDRVIEGVSPSAAVRGLQNRKI
ncbi:MAG: pyridoxamine 5'-phosphate oxidase family protein [Woeseiaceae bacterium]|nr:pyridoxamine 5'-phosphate oxidase family protein [Woeseiaceae bacterium]